MSSELLELIAYKEILLKDIDNKSNFAIKNKHILKSCGGLLTDIITSIKSNKAILIDVMNEIDRIDNCKNNVKKSSWLYRDKVYNHLTKEL